jgi:hypothetical protein
MKPARMGVNADGQAVLFCAHLRDVAMRSRKADHSACIHLLGFVGASGGRRAAR